MPQSLIVHLRELLHLLGIDDSEQIVCPSTGAMHQDQPSRLQIWDQRDPLDESALLVERALQLGCDVLSVAKRGSQDLQPLLIGGTSDPLQTLAPGSAA